MTSSGESREPKTRGSRRTLRMPTALVEVLAAHLDRMEAEREMMVGTWPDQWSELVFVSEGRTSIDSHNLRRLFRRWSADAGLDRPGNPYMLPARTVRWPWTTAPTSAPWPRSWATPTRARPNGTTSSASLR
jgi:hypothetical protein